MITRYIGVNLHSHALRQQDVNGRCRKLRQIEIRINWIQCCVFIVTILRSVFRPITMVVSSGVTIIFGPPGKHSLRALVHLWTSNASRQGWWFCEIPVHSLITVLIHNSGHFGPLPPPRHWLPMASYATGRKASTKCCNVAQTRAHALTPKQTQLSRHNNTLSCHLLYLYTEQTNATQTTT